MPNKKAVTGAIPVVGSVLGGYLESEGAKDAASAEQAAARYAAETQLEATKLTIEELKRQYEQTREDYAPYRDVGEYYLNVLGGDYMKPSPQITSREGKQFAVTDTGQKILPETGKINPNWQVDDQGNVFVGGQYSGYVENGQVRSGMRGAAGTDFRDPGMQYTGRGGKQFTVTPEGYRINQGSTEADPNWRITPAGKVKVKQQAPFDRNIERTYKSRSNKEFKTTPEGYKVSPDTGDVNRNWQVDESGNIFIGGQLQQAYIDPATGSVVEGAAPTDWQVIGYSDPSGQIQDPTTPSGTWGYPPYGAGPQSPETDYGAYPGDPNQRGAYEFPAEPMAPAFSYPAEPVAGQFDFDPRRVSESPGYQFRLAEGEKAIERAGSAGGRRLSGRQLKELQNYAQGLASTEYGNEWSRQANQYQDYRDYLGGVFGREYGRRAGEYGDYRSYLSGMHGRERDRGFQTYGDYRNRMAALAGVGQTATAGTAAAGASAASGTADALMRGAENVGVANLLAGRAKSGGKLGEAGAWGDTISTITDYLTERLD